MKHGTPYGYDHRGCRCGECSAAKRRKEASRYVPSRHTLTSSRLSDPDDVDLVAVERVCKGVAGIELNRAEALVAFSWMDVRGFAAREIARRLGVTERTVQRWRAASRTAAEMPERVAS